MPRGLSRRAYAVHAGVSETAVRKAIKGGRITLGRDGLIDPKVADRQWRENTDPTKPLNRSTGDPKHRKESPDAPSVPMSLDGKGGDAVAKFTRARAMREGYHALLTKLEYEEKLGNLVPKERVRAAAAAAANIVSNLILTRPDRLAKVLAGISDPDGCRKVLEKDARRTCETLHKEIERASRVEKPAK